MSLLQFAREELGEVDLETQDILSFLRKCDVHFKRSVTALTKNANIVAPEKKKNFASLSTHCAMRIRIYLALKELAKQWQENSLMLVSGWSGTFIPSEQDIISLPAQGSPKKNTQDLFG